MATSGQNPVVLCPHRHAGRPFLRPPPVVRRRDRRRADGDARRGGRAASRNVVTRPRHRDADAQPAHPWRGGAGRHLRVPALGVITRLTPPVVRRRDRRVRMGMRGGRKAPACMLARRRSWRAYNLATGAIRRGEFTRYRESRFLHLGTPLASVHREHATPLFAEFGGA
jgi:hypothetical protein